MTAEEKFARKGGPALSVAHHLYKMGNPPSIGQSWSVDVVAVSGEPTDPMLEADASHFTFELKITPELLMSAERLLEWVKRRKAAVPHLPMWYLVEGGKILYLKVPPPDIAITEDDLRASIDRSSTVEREIRGYPRDLWILHYLAKNWLPHIPFGESQDYYRGQTHGFRLVLSSLDTLFASDESATMTMLGIVHIFLAATSAKSYFRLCPKLKLEAESEWHNAMPAAGHLHRLAPFQLGTEELESLAKSADIATTQPLSPMTPGPLEVFRSYEHLVPLNETIHFYRGLIHASQISVRSIRLFDQFPLVDDIPRLSPKLESGTALISCLAAQQWLRKPIEKPI